MDKEVINYRSFKIKLTGKELMTLLGANSNSLVIRRTYGGGFGIEENDKYIIEWEEER